MWPLHDLRAVVRVSACDRGSPSAGFLSSIVVDWPSVFIRAMARKPRTWISMFYRRIANHEKRFSCRTLVADYFDQLPTTAPGLPLLSDKVIIDVIWSNGEL